MAGTIATLLSGAKSIAHARGPLRHAYDELVDLQTSLKDPDLASPYLQASAVNTIPARASTATSGNFTVTVNFPKYGVAVTTANIAYNATGATVQSAVDTALSGESILATYSAGDVDVALTGNMDDTGNDCVITANGTSVNGAYMTITTANVDLGADTLTTPVVTTPGTQNRPAEATLKILGIVQPTGDVTPQGLTVAIGDYELVDEADNPLTVSPGLQDLLIKEVAQEDDALAIEFRRLVGCV